jgi:hypothetical protein
MAALAADADDVIDIDELIQGVINESDVEDLIALTPDRIMLIIERLTETVDIDVPSALRLFLFYKNVKLHNGINNYITSFLEETDTKRNPVSNAIHANASNDPRLRNLKFGVLSMLYKMRSHPEITNANRLLVSTEIRRLESLPNLGKKSRRYKKSKKSRKTNKSRSNKSRSNKSKKSRSKK